MQFHVKKEISFTTKIESVLKRTFTSKTDNVRRNADLFFEVNLTSTNIVTLISFLKWNLTSKKINVHRSANLFFGMTSHFKKTMFIVTQNSFFEMKFSFQTMKWNFIEQKHFWSEISFQKHNFHRSLKWNFTSNNNFFVFKLRFTSKKHQFLKWNFISEKLKFIVTWNCHFKCGIQLEFNFKLDFNSIWFKLFF